MYNICIGGIGGSGTRAVVELFYKLGYFIGEDLNKPKDNLLFTLLFKHRDVLIIPKNELKYRLELFYTLMKDTNKLNIKDLDYVKQLALKKNILHPKEWLLDRYENLKFIYVYRNGLDMAYSTNQNQLKLWGSIFLEENNLEISPKNSLKYWCEVDKRIRKYIKIYPNRIFMLSLEEFCLNTLEKIKELFLFLGLEAKIDENLLSVFNMPNSVGRYKKYSLENFDNEDLDYIINLYGMDKI